MSSWESYLTPQELNAYTQYFRATSRSQQDVVTGLEAVQFFATSGVPNQILSDIWEAADRDNVGYLTPETFAIALKLIACAQHGKEVTEPVLATSVPLPQFEGLKLDNNNIVISTIPSSNSPAIATQKQPQQADGPGMRLTSAEREKYISIFRVHQPVDGVLDATNAKNIFMKSKLSNETLGQIWNLADVRQAGNLNQTEFAIAMHYIAKLMDGTLSTLPTELPSSVYATANGDTNTSVVQPSPSPQHVVPSPHTLPSQQPQRSQTIDSLGTMAFSSGNPAPGNMMVGQQQWDVTPQEKAQFDTFFDKIDGQKTGFVQGTETVEFFKNSRLPENDLAHIWDLADTNQQGRLTREQFAVAMHLIHKRLQGDALPNTLPQSLIPPSPHPQQQQIAQSPAMTQQQVTGLSAASVQPSAMTGGNVFDDQDLLGDFGNNDQLTHDTNQVNQLQNQISAFKQSTPQIQGQKIDANKTLEQLSHQKQELQAQLAQVQMQHEAELKELNELQQQLENEKPGFIQATQEHEAAQQQLTKTQNEIAELQQALEGGRTESERLRQNVHTIQEETQRLMNDLNALRNQVKQQNMMLDINRRQVTASEQDRDQAKRDLSDFKEERGLPNDIEIPTNKEEKNEEQDATKTGTEKSSVSIPETSSLHSNNNSNNFFDVFSPKSENDNASKESPAITAAPNDFDAIFGNFGGEQASPIVEKKKQDSPLSVFDPVGWATSPETATVSPATAATKSSRPAPPPPPPQSRHHRQASDQSHVSTPTTPLAATSTKKPRAPPPPPPANKSASITSPVQQQSSSVFGNDDFDSAFASEQLNEATAATDGFDDAFGVFDDNTRKENEPAKQEEEQEGKEEEKNNKGVEQAQKSSGNDLNWATDFGGFEFSEENNSKKEQKQEDDWDSIFGGSSNKGVTTTGATSNNNTQTVKSDEAGFDGFEDAFSNFDTAATTAQKTTTPSSGNSNLDDLLKMGFGEKEAKDALNRYDQDLGKATNFLLDQSTK
ncbi:hypothetical protein INT45_000255 [Circinella minor]|uniref:Uncharacterized protein n=1 Tax=Circinella minor TaxID=1195481 RepID=A0A8H7VIL1_9FUNG|nr:hypothetical protein INT45_000255 [Circinella minor]